MDISWIIATIVCFTSVVLLRPIAVGWGLVDTPNNRKRHVGDIPLTGGLAIYLSTLTSISLFAEGSQQINLILVSISFMVFIGVLDDKYDLNAKLRLIAQVLIASVLTFGTDIHIYNLGNIFGFGEISTGPFSGVVTILAIIAGINAFNMTDGIDGLAGSLSLVSLLSISLIVTGGDIQVLISVISAALIVFLLFNLGLFSKKYKVFMGDAGSMMLGLVVSWLLILTSQSEQASITPANVLWFIGVPIIDMIAVMYRRVRRGQSPLVADRGHLHHVFMDIGLNPRQALLFITAISICFASLGIYVTYQELPGFITLLLFLSIFVIYNKMLSLRHKFVVDK